MDYASAVAELTSRGRFGISLGLERVARLMDELDHPERELHGALIGGTNGKGSVVAMTRSVLVAAGLRVGSMPKPHLVSYRERIALDGSPLSPKRFAAAVEGVLPAIDRVTAALGPPTEFEALTAAAIRELARSNIDVALVEVGMGGRLDATNVLDLGVACITNVQLDHERYLGSTLAKIGTEKAAIIKRGNLAVSGTSGRGLRPILDRCARLGIALRRPARVLVQESGWDGLRIDVGALRDLHIGLLGSHQAANAAVALALVDALRDDGERRGTPRNADEAAIRQGMRDVRWPGRLELLTSDTFGRVLLDGAHNPAGARALAQALRELGVSGPPLVFGAMRGKRVGAVLRALAPLDPRFIFTAVADPGAHVPAELRRIWGADAQVTATPNEALERAAQMRRGEEPIVVAGSLYLVGAVRGILTGEQEEAA